MDDMQDLAKGLALLCVVFNCGEGLDYKAMGSIFSGLVQCGAWGCFDEFNRIEAEVLSVVSSQIKQIQEAMKNDLTRFLFEGREISIDSRCGALCRLFRRVFDKSHLNGRPLRINFKTHLISCMAHNHTVV